MGAFSSKPARLKLEVRAGGVSLEKLMFDTKAKDVKALRQELAGSSELSKYNVASLENVEVLSADGFKIPDGDKIADVLKEVKEAGSGVITVSIANTSGSVAAAGAGVPVQIKQEEQEETADEFNDAQEPGAKRRRVEQEGGLNLQRGDLVNYAVSQYDKQGRASVVKKQNCVVQKNTDELLAVRTQGGAYDVVQKNELLNVSASSSSSAAAGGPPAQGDTRWSMLDVQAAEAAGERADELVHIGDWLQYRIYQENTRNGKMFMSDVKIGRVTKVGGSEEGDVALTVSLHVGGSFLGVTDTVQLDALLTPFVIREKQHVQLDDSAAAPAPAASPVAAAESQSTVNSDSQSAEQAAPAPPKPTLTENELAFVKQIEHYFANFEKDSFLKRNLESDGSVALNTVLSFARMKRMMKNDHRITCVGPPEEELFAAWMRDYDSSIVEFRQNKEGWHYVHRLPQADKDRRA